MKKASPQTGRVEVTSLHGFIYENAAHCPVGRRCSQLILDILCCADYNIILDNCSVETIILR
jgi:hypothetical protein